MRRAVLFTAAVAGLMVAGAGAGRSFFFVEQRTGPLQFDAEFEERLRQLATGRRAAARGQSELPELLLWPLRALGLLFVLLVAALVVAGIARGVRRLAAMRRLRLLLGTGRVVADGYDDGLASDADAVTALRERLRHSLDVGREHLDDGVTAREVVIACYQGLERAAAGAGTTPSPAETPSQLVYRVLADHAVPAASARQLVELYEQARFSPHPVDDEMRASARRCLGDIRSALGAG